MSWGDNVYYKPEAFGLTLLETLDWLDEPYEFHMTVAWTDAEGNLYWAYDSGCSCPSPFEDYTSVESLKTGTLHELFAELDADLSEWWDESAASRVAQFKEGLLRKCR